MSRLVPNPAYEEAPYEVTLLLDGKAWPHPHPYPYRYARAEDYDPTNPRRNAVPPLIEVGDASEDVAFTSVDAAHKLALGNAADAARKRVSGYTAAQRAELECAARATITTGTPSAGSSPTQVPP